ncbi:MAG TPA: hypothetical protein VHY33_04235 [Thermoanaerobaculia bacterium]|jgi:hypothetical protein|nr:hypothetical protein [Thermoanaerobaculia bacterium]
MGTVNINFLGVCTIFRNLEVTPGEVINRVVLARTTEAFQRLTGVVEHIAKLQFGADEIIIDQGPGLPPFRSPFQPPAAGSYELDQGVRLTIPNAKRSTELLPERGLDCLPSLAVFLDGTIGPPASWVFNPDIENVQAWFDFNGGEALAYKLNPEPPCDIVPSITVLTIETQDDPQLEYKPLGGLPTLITLKSALEPPSIYVMNFAEGQGVIEDNKDFLLNYCLVDPFPDISKISIPRANACLLPSPGTPVHFPRCGDAGPGCSNTTYP